MPFALHCGGGAILPQLLLLVVLSSRPPRVAQQTSQVRVRTCVRPEPVVALIGRRGHTSALSANRATFAVLLVLDRTTTTYHHHLDIGIGIGIGIAAPSPSIGTVP